MNALLYRAMVVVGVGAFVCMVRPAVASAAQLRAEADPASVEVGVRITVTVSLDTEGQAANAAESGIRWDSNILTLQQISTAGSIFQYWAVEPVQQSSSTAFFSGGLPDPGFSGHSGMVVQLLFLARAEGESTIDLTPGGVLANDGRATSLPVSQQSARVIVVHEQGLKDVAGAVLVPTISSPSHPDQSTWSTNPTVELKWTGPEGANGFSTSLSTDPNVTPVETASTTDYGATVTLQEDGIWYFRLRARVGAQWSQAARYIVRFDRTAPEHFTPTVLQDRGVSDPTPEVDFSATDKASGVAGYSITIDGGSARSAVSPVVLVGLSGGDHTIIVTARDEAGNTQSETASFMTSGIPAPSVTGVATPVLLLEPIRAWGMARLGDTITVYIDDVAVQTLTPGAGTVSPSGSDGTSVLVPWTVRIDGEYRPGKHHITVSATQLTGEQSVTADPVEFTVTGHYMNIHGRPVATVAVVTPILVLLGSIAALIVAVMARLLLAVVLMHRHTLVAESDVERLRQTNLRQPIPRQDLNNALENIELDLEGGDIRRVRKMQRRRTKRKRT